MESNLKSSGNPNQEQLSIFLSSTSKNVSSLLTNAPVRLKIIVKEGFSAFGWDVVTNQVARSLRGSCKPLLAQNVLTGLKNLKAELLNFSLPVAPTKEELQSISLACMKLWELDSNRVLPDHDYQLDLQRGKFASDTYDAAPRKLFQFLDEKVFEKPTYKAFLALLDNYLAELGKAEEVTPEELVENMKFLNLIMVNDS